MNLGARILGRLRREAVRRMPPDRIARRLAARRGVLVLSYHALGPLDGYPFRTSPQAFAAQIDFLRGIFDILPAAEAVAGLRDRSVLRRARPAAVITFDDAYRDTWEVATPILERHGLPATLFAPRDLVRRGGATHMDEAGLVQLAAHPLWTVGPHGITHNALTAFRPEDQERELAESRAWLADLLGAPPAAFAYPQGQFAAATVAAAKRHYDCAFSTDRRLGAAFDPWTIRRHCPVADEDDPAVFAAALMMAPMEDGIQ